MTVSRRTALGRLALLATAASAIPLTGWAVQPIKIGIVGSGNMGGTIGRLWVEAGHEVLFSSRNPQELLSMTHALGSRASAGTPAQAAAFGSALLFAVPYDALPQLGQDLASALRGKVVLDACNPRPGANALSREAYARGVGVTSARLLPGTRLVRAFSAVDSYAARASAAGQSPGKLGVPLAGDDAQAIEIASQLIRDIDCEPVVTGNLASSRGFDNGGPGFRANTTAPELRRLLGMA